MDIISKDEYYGSVERSIYKMKERIRCVSQNTPYKSITRLMVTECIFDVITGLYSFTSQYGVSNELSYSKIVLGKGKLDYDTRKITTVE